MATFLWSEAGSLCAAGVDRMLGDDASGGMFKYFLKIVPTVYKGTGEFGPLVAHRTFAELPWLCSLRSDVARVSTR